MGACRGSNTAAPHPLNDLITRLQSTNFTQFSKNYLNIGFKGGVQATKPPIKTEHLDTSKHTRLISVVILTPQRVV